MPVKGFKAVTVPEDFYSDIKRFYDEHRSELRERGVTSLQACLQLFVYQGIKQYKHSQEQGDEMRNAVGETASNLMRRLSSQKTNSPTRIGEELNEDPQTT